MKIIALQTNIHISSPAKVLEFSNSWKKKQILGRGEYHKIPELCSGLSTLKVVYFSTARKYVTFRNSSCKSVPTCNLHNFDMF